MIDKTLETQDIVKTSEDKIRNMIQEGLDEENPYLGEISDKVEENDEKIKKPKDFPKEASQVLKSIDKREEAVRVSFSGITTLTDEHIDYIVYKLNKLNITTIILEFSGCTSLEDIDLSNLKALQQINFSGCTNLRNFSLESGKRYQEVDISDCPNIKDKTVSILKTNLLKCAGCTGLVNPIFDTRSIDFSGCKNLTNPIFKNINKGDLKFSDLENLQNPTISDSKIDNIEFSGCTKLTNPIFKNLNIENNIIFSNLTNLQNPTINDSKVVSILFSGCTKLINPIFKNLDLCNIYLDSCNSLENPIFSNLVFPEIGNGFNGIIFLGKNLLTNPIFENLKNIERFHLAEISNLKNPVFKDFGYEGMYLDLSYANKLEKPIFENFLCNVILNPRMELKTTYGVENFTLFSKFFSDKELTFGKISDIYVNNSVLSGLLKTANINKRKKGETNNQYCIRIQNIYQKNVMRFIEEGKHLFYQTEITTGGKEKVIGPKSNNYVFYIYPRYGGAADKGANIPLKEEFKKLSGKYKFYDYDYNKGSEITFEGLLQNIKKVNAFDEDANIIISLAGDGGADGSIDFPGNTIPKEEFSKLLNSGTNVHLFLTSCYSGFKDNNLLDNNLGSVTFDSSFQPSVGGGSFDNSSYDFSSADYQTLTYNKPQYYRSADFDGDGYITYHEAVVFRMLRYSASLTPTVFYPDRDPKTPGIEIGENLEVPKNEKENKD